MEVIGTMLLFVGLIMVLIGGIWFLVVAFQENVLWVLAGFFFPFVWLIFLFMHYDKAEQPFLIQLAGVVVSIGGAAML